MNAQHQSTFENTMQGYAQGFRVSHIATFGLENCAPNEEVQAVFDRLPAFDQIPVLDDRRTIGVLERDGEDLSGIVANHMRSLDDSILVSADESLRQFLPLMENKAYYLVIEGSKVNGIVTRSDILKLPVRLYAFALVTNLELLMTEIIQQEFPRDLDWLKFISSGRREKVKEEKDNYQQKRMDPPLIELTNFCDKYTVLLKHYKTLKSEDFKSDIVKIEQRLRNPLAHAKSFANNQEELREFLDLVKKTQDWTQKLSHYLN